MKYSTCHTERPVYAKGLCHKCYDITRREGRKKNAVLHKGALAKYYANYREEHREQHSAYGKTYRLANKERIAKRLMRYGLHNRPKLRNYLKQYNKSRRATDPSFRITNSLRARLSSALKNNQKSGSAIADLGCSVQHLKLHLELFWDEGMTWSNYGNKEGQWSIDHIQPLSRFDLTDREQFLTANHYMNLQPLWHRDNMIKFNN